MSEELRATITKEVAKLKEKFPELDAGLLKIQIINRILQEVNLQLATLEAVKQFLLSEINK